MLAYKSSKANIEGCTKLFLMMGLVLTLIVVSVLINHKFKDVTSDEVMSQTSKVIIDETFIPETEIEPEELIKPQQQTPVPTPVLENIKIVEDDKLIQETVLTSTETSLDEAIVVQKIDYTQVQEEVIEEEIVEDVPFFAIEKVPVFPGCKGDKEALRRCLEERVQQHVSKNFNASLSENLGLDSGIQRIFVTFIIDQNGHVTEIKSRAPHKSLQQEAERVINLLPEMEPGEQRGRPVRVKYSLPIIFKVVD